MYKIPTFSGPLNNTQRTGQYYPFPLYFPTGTIHPFSLQLLTNLSFKVHVKNPIGFVHDEEFQRFEIEAFRIFEMIYESAGSRHEDVGLFGQHHGLRHHIHTTWNKNEMPWI